MLWDTLIKAVLAVIDKVIPDPMAKATAQLKLLEMEQTGQLASLKAETDLALKQIEVNVAEAAAEDPYVSRWRPSVGWVCVIGLFYNYTLQPILPWVIQVFGGTAVPLPPVPVADLYPLLLGILGLGSMRTIEKLNGKQ